MHTKQYASFLIQYSQYRQCSKLIKIFRKLTCLLDIYVLVQRLLQRSVVAYYYAFSSLFIEICTKTLSRRELFVMFGKFYCRESKCLKWNVHLKSSEHFSFAPSVDLQLHSFPFCGTNLIRRYICSLKTYYCNFILFLSTVFIAPLTIRLYNLFIRQL